MLTIVTLALVAFGIAMSLRFRRRQEYFIVIPLLVACAIAVVSERNMRHERDEFSAFIKSSCALLSDQIRSDAYEFRQLIGSNQSTPQDLLKVQSHYLKSSIERAHLAKQCIRGPVSLKCIPPGITEKNVDEVERGADAVRIGKCPD